MTEPWHRTFEFERRLEGCERSVALIREFSAAQLLRSAAVEELELDEGSFRRPARPEDLSLIDFSTPVTAATATRLPFLASNRLLFAINEQRTVQWVFGQDIRDGSGFREFYADTERELGRQIAPFLEDFAFSFLEAAEAPPTNATAAVERIGRHLERVREFRVGLLPRLARRQYLEPGLGFLLMQDWSLANAKRRAMRLAGAAGCFDIIPNELRPPLDDDDSVNGLLAALARRCGVIRQGHSYWQFYLSSSLARCNLLHALAQRPIAAFRMIGAAYCAGADWLAFLAMARHAAEQLGVATEHQLTTCDDGGVALLGRFDNVVRTVEQQYGHWAVREIVAGLAMAGALTEHAHHDLGEQLTWLSSLDCYQQFAHTISERIQREAPDIDRETFVEPREMCSTTHVHDDHRLVVIESGNMVFWGNRGMTLRLKPGEMVLVPQGRLHGSSIESDECVYHQPIIPDDWIDALLRPAETELVD